MTGVARPLISLEARNDTDPVQRTTLPWPSSLLGGILRWVPMTLTIEFERDADGRWIAEVPELPGVLVYGETQDKAAQLARALAFRVLADQIEAGDVDVTMIATESFAA